MTDGAFIVKVSAISLRVPYRNMCTDQHWKATREDSTLKTTWFSQSQSRTGRWVGLRQSSVSGSWWGRWWTSRETRPERHPSAPARSSSPAASRAPPWRPKDTTVMSLNASSERDGQLEDWIWRLNFRVLLVLPGSEAKLQQEVKVFWFCLTKTSMFCLTKKIFLLR